MNFRVFTDCVGTSDLWKFLEFSGNDIVVENPKGEVESKPVDFLDSVILEVSFLDYTIVNSGNSDGWVITKVPSVFNDFKVENYEHNLGNFTNLEDAKESCVCYFMIARPQTFARTISNKMNKVGGTYHEGFLLKDCLKREGIPIPSEIGYTNDSNCMITFNGKEI